MSTMVNFLDDNRDYKITRLIAEGLGDDYIIVNDVNIFSNRLNCEVYLDLDDDVELDDSKLIAIKRIFRELSKYSIIFPYLSLVYITNDAVILVMDTFNKSEIPYETYEIVVPKFIINYTAKLLTDNFIIDDTLISKYDTLTIKNVNGIPYLYAISGDNNFAPEFEILYEYTEGNIGIFDITVDKHAIYLKYDISKANFRFECDNKYEYMKYLHNVLMLYQKHLLRIVNYNMLIGNFEMKIAPTDYILKFNYGKISLFDLSQVEYIFKLLKYIDDAIVEALKDKNVDYDLYDELINKAFKLVFDFKDHIDYATVKNAINSLISTLMI